VLEDDDAITITDDESDPEEQRFVSIGRGRRRDCWWWSIVIEAETYASSRPGWQERMNAGNTREHDEAAI
jgi:hypothetical protein